MNFLTPTQFKVLKFAWKMGKFTVLEAQESGLFGKVSQDTIRTNVKRVTEKDYLVEHKKKPVFYTPAISKQEYFIQMARIWFADASEEEKKFFKWAMDQV